MEPPRLLVGAALGALFLLAGCAGDATAVTTTTGVPSTTTSAVPAATTDDGEQAAGFDVYLQAADVGPDCNRVVAVPRIATVEGPEADALAQLLAGPTPAEAAQGLGSWFSAATAGMLRSVVIEDGVARVDFDPALATTIPNASASCGSSLLLAQLDATAGQFGTTDRIVYSLGGDVDAFYGWLQLTTPEQRAALGSTTTGSTRSSGRHTVTDLESALATEIGANYPPGPGQSTCDASGTLSDWQPVLCYFNPDDPAEFGGIHVSVLDGGRYAWSVGGCCAGSPWAEDYPPGLLCRDLLQPPQATGPDFYPADSNHLTYGLAVYYWLTEGRPARMDADRNGRPCETVYPPVEVDAFWASVQVL